LHRHIIALRRNRDQTTAGLRRPNADVLRADQDNGLIVLHRWPPGGPHGDTIAVLHSSTSPAGDYRRGMPPPGRWAVRLSADSSVYDSALADHSVFDTVTDPAPADGCAQSATLAVGAYSFVVLSLEP